MWYKSLFFGVHALIKTEEMDTCSLTDAISLIDRNNEDFTVDLVKYIQQRFAQQETTDLDKSNKVEDFLRSSKVYFNPQLIVPLYLGFMNTICRIIPDFEKETFNLVISENVQAQVKDNTFTLYQEIINKTADSLSEMTIENISKMDRYSGYSHEVAVQLYNNEYYLDYTLLLLQQNTSIPFERNEIRKDLENCIEWLTSQKEYFLQMRNQLAKCQADILLQYSFMFGIYCPVLTSEELQSIQSNNENSEQIIFKLIPAELVTQDNYEMLSSYFCRKKQTNNLTFEILMYISTFSPEISRLCFYALDFNMVRYRYIAGSKKYKIKQAYYDILQLVNPSEKIHFMKVTKYLDTVWEITLLNSLKNDPDLQDSYIEVVNNSETITKYTIQSLCKLGTIHAMSPLVNQKLFENKKYTEYVVSVMLENSRFDLADNELKNELWPTYIKIFSSSSFSTPREYMSRNLDFLRCVMSEKSYQGFPEENRLQLCGVYQDRDSITNVIEYGTNFALRYYSTMEGFLDEDAAIAFLTIIESSSELIASDDLYNHTHDMLISGKLKARYTNVRKKNGYGI